MGYFGGLLLGCQFGNGIGLGKSLVIKKANHQSNLFNRLGEMRRFSYLTQNLIVRDIKIRYRNSLLGVLWSLLTPLFMMLVFSFVFKVAFPNNDVRQYSVFVLVGLIPWNFFNGALRLGTVSFVSNSVLIKKVYFPRELLPFSAIVSELVNFGIAFFVLIIFLYGSGLALTIHALWVPLILLTQVLLTVGLALLLGSINVFYRDVGMILDVALLALFFLTPIMYSLDQYGTTTAIAGFTFNIDPAQIMRWVNPMASIVDGYRTVLWGTTSSNGPVSMHVPFLLRTFVTSLLIFIVGYIFFLRTESQFGERL
ncbi:MAG: ABC transporter permease [Anaerolineae bacterium]